MTDPRATTPGAEELRDCAPRRDFAPAGGAREMRLLPDAVPLPADRDMPPADGLEVMFVAAVAVLLALHSRRGEISLNFEHRGGTAARGGVLRVDIRPDRTFDDLARWLKTATSVAMMGTDQPIATDGVRVEVLDGCGHTSSGPGDLVFRLRLGSSVDIAFDGALYREDSVRPLARQLGQLLAEARRRSTSPLGELASMDAEERERVLHGFNATRVSFPIEHTLADLIEAQSARTPHAICAVHGPRSLTFAELDARAGQLARLLVALGVGPGRFVALLERRGLDFVVAMVAIWKAGGAYVPVDPDYPEARVRLMLADSEVAVAVAGAEAGARFAPALAASTALRDVVLLGKAGLEPASIGGARLHDIRSAVGITADGNWPRARPSDPAYMIYTSGSTGRPKGAIVRQDGAVNHIYAQALALGREHVSRFLQTAPSSSDISVWQFAAPLVFGGTTAVIDDGTDVEAMLDHVRRHDLHVIELVPVVLRRLVDFAAVLPDADRALPSLRWVIVTGESSSVELVNAWLALYPQIPVVNAYGPSEAADDVVQAILRDPLPPRQLTVPIGRPLANLDLYVLDDRLEPLPVGAPGEICIAGVGVGSGYWKQPDKTRSAFVPNPFPGSAGTVIYRTGDLGRWRDDGTLECFGRLDDQVQLRGIRIELQEIESVLRLHAGVRDAVVLAFHDGRGDGQLVAYVVDGPLHTDDPELRAHLVERLPSHMVPTAFVRLDSLPLNPAGKVDRKALPAPALTPRVGRAEHTPPQGAVEQGLAAIWQQELGATRIGRHDDFFALGGDSLTALAIVVGAREAGWRLRTADVLAHPTLSQLAAVVKPVASSSPTVADPALPPLAPDIVVAGLASAAGVEAVWPLTPPQQGLYLHWLLSRDKTTYIDQYDYDIVGELDATAFTAAWNHVVARHPALRTAFLRGAARQPLQAVLQTVRVDVERVDLSKMDEGQRAETLHTLGAAEVARGFDLARPPLMRLLLVRLAPHLHRLVWTHHHIALDGWSLALVLDEVLLAHTAFQVGQQPGLPPVVSYGRYVEQLSQTDITGGLAHWRQALAGWRGAPGMGLPLPSRPVRGHASVDACLGLEATASLMARARVNSLTLTTLLQASWAALLGRIGSCDDVVFGAVSSGRELPLPGIGQAVGLFVTTLPMRVRLATPGLDTSHWLAELQQSAAALRDCEAVPLARIARACALPAGTELFDTLFVMSNFPEPAPGDGPLRIAPAGFRTVPGYALSLIVVPGRELRLRLVHDRERVEDASVASLVQSLAQLLERVAFGEDLRQAATTVWPRPDGAGTPPTR